MSVNKVIILGNVGNEPEVKQLNNGKVANVSVATSEKWKDKNTGERKEKTEWHRVVFYSPLADIVERYINKGSKIYLEGTLQTRSWEQDGSKRYATEIIGRSMQMLDGKPNQSPVQNTPVAPPVSDIDLDDLPF